MKKNFFTKILIYVLMSSFFGWHILNMINSADKNYLTAAVFLSCIIVIICCFAIIFSKNYTVGEKTPEILKAEPLISLTDNMPIPSYITDAEGNLLYSNKDFKKIAGIENNEQVYDLSKIFTNIPLSELMNDNCDVINGQKTLIKECFLKFKENQSGWFKIHKTPITDKYGNVLYIQVFLKDISAEKELYSQKERFIATLNHDLKTPIIAQIRSLEMLLNGNFGEISSNQREILELTVNSCGNIYNMISTILSSYKLENNEIELAYEDVNFTELVMKCCEKMQKEAEEKQLEFIIKPQSSNNKVKADVHYLGRAVLFLLENSISYAYHNSAIEILINNDSDTLTFEILAKSHHIAEETLKTMMHKYRGQISNYNKIGFCLKLNYCNQVIKAHRGHIVIKSIMNNKNTLGFQLPLSIESFT